MADRSQAFEALADDAFYCSSFRKLKAADKAVIRSFISARQHLDRDGFAFEVNRMFLGRPKPRNFALIMDLLTAANAKA